MRWLGPQRLGVACVVLAACAPVPDRAPAASSTTPAGEASAPPPRAQASTSSSAPVPPPSSTPGTATPLTGAKMSELQALESEIRSTIPKGAGDYAHVVALATLFKRGKLTYEELEAAILALALPPHRLGDGYLMILPPPPPPPATFDPKMMPKDWEGNWGLVAQAYFLGELTRDQYERLHRAAHPSCKK